MWLASVIVTRSPPDTGLTALIVFVVLEEPRAPRWSTYTHFSPTAIGNRGDPAAVVCPPLEPLAVADVLACDPLEPEPEPVVGLDEHPAMSSPATASAAAGVCRFMSCPFGVSGVWHQ